MTAARLPHRAPRRLRAGVTLVELMIGVAIALFMTAAAVAFARHETKLMGVSNERVNMQQNARAAIELLVEDLQSAGVGVGYNMDGVYAGPSVANAFAGLRIDGNFTPAFSTGAAFNTGPGQGTALQLETSSPNGAATTGSPYVLNTIDVGIVRANGVQASIVGYAPGFVTTCSSGGVQFNANDTVVLRAEDGITAIAASVNADSGAAFACPACVGGCINFPVNAMPAIFSSATAALAISYRGGEVQGGFETVVWFVTDNSPQVDPSVDANVGVLRRAVFDNANTCAARDGTCGQRVIDYIDSLQAVVWQWDSTARAWVNIGSTPPTTKDRLRVDLELVVRSRADNRVPRDSIPLRLAPGNCVPNIGGTCPASDVDLTERQVLRTSVDIKNSGFMTMD